MLLRCESLEPRMSHVGHGEKNSQRAYLVGLSRGSRPPADMLVSSRNETGPTG
jgi:hypothetical protein